jgi:hypothetical protein
MTNIPDRDVSHLDLIRFKHGHHRRDDRRAAGCPCRAVAVAIAQDGQLQLARPLPEALLTARALVARDFGMDEDWLNPGPTDLLKWGLPEGFMTRVIAKRYGSALLVYFAGRVDQVHFKLFAMVDQGGGRHEADLRALAPSPAELIAAGRWSLTQDPSPGYKMVLADALRYLGVDNADLGG